MWGDSTFAIAWIYTNPNLLQTFLGNRSPAIQTLVKIGRWISGAANSVYHVSRGVFVQDLINWETLWLGAQSLRSEGSTWLENYIKLAEIQDMRTQRNKKLLVIKTTVIFSRFSPFYSLLIYVDFVLSVFTKLLYRIIGYYIITISRLSARYGGNYVDRNVN